MFFVDMGDAKICAGELFQEMIGSPDCLLAGVKMKSDLELREFGMVDVKSTNFHPEG